MCDVFLETKFGVHRGGHQQDLAETTAGPEGGETTAGVWKLGPLKSEISMVFQHFSFIFLVTHIAIT